MMLSVMVGDGAHEAVDALFELCKIAEPDEAATKPEIVKARETLDQASATLFAFRISKYVNKKTGTAKIKAISGFCKAFYTVTAKRENFLPPAVAQWAGIVEGAVAKTEGGDEQPLAVVQS